MRLKPYRWLAIPAGVVFAGVASLAGFAFFEDDPLAPLYGLHPQIREENNGWTVLKFHYTLADMTSDQTVGDFFRNRFAPAQIRPVGEYVFLDSPITYDILNPDGTVLYKFWQAGGWFSEGDEIWIRESAFARARRQVRIGMR